jgi:hypothetical protein
MTTQPTDDTPPEKHFDDHSVIVPPHRLKKAVKHTRGTVNIDMSAVERAEAALDELKVEFVEWMNAECERLDEARRQIVSKGLTRQTVDALFLPAHDIKGGATTLGYPLAERLATSLCRLLKHTPNAARIPLALVEHHVDGIRAIVREDVRNARNPYGLELSERLSIMTETFLSEELQDAYVEIAGDAVTRIPMPARNQK